MTTKKSGSKKTSSKKGSATKKAVASTSKSTTKSSGKKRGAGPRASAKVAAKKLSSAKPRATRKVAKKLSASPTSEAVSATRKSAVAAGVADSQLSLFDVSSPAASRELSATPATPQPQPPTATVRPRPQTSPTEHQPSRSLRWPESVVVHTDGACRGNPGPSSIGLHFLDAQGADLDRVGERIGNQTNNYAEYTAVIRALEMAARHGVRRLTVRSDSELMVRQMQGVYKVKSEAIRPLFERVQQLQRQFTEVRFEHVRREFNAEADRLANLALDGRL